MLRATLRLALFLLISRVALAEDGPSIVLVESAPVETTLDHADIPNAGDVWLDMVQNAQKSLDFAEFYCSSKPGSKLEAVLSAVLDASERGVHVRFLADAKFAKTYPGDLARLEAKPNIEVRRIDFGALTDGVLHAKYFLVDGRELYVGSQNFDYRSLEHIQELGLRMRDPALVSSLQDVFETDWAIAGGDAKARVHASTAQFPVKLPYGGADLSITPLYSPKGWLPDEASWDLPRLVSMIDGATSTVRVQMLNYKTTEKDGTRFDDLDSALRRAAKRGVKVQMIVADWSQKPGTIETIQSLQKVDNIDVKLMTIPQYSGGFIDFARVVHAKFLVVDGKTSWIGTANWGSDYFYASRNVGYVLEGASMAGQLDAFFLDNWGSDYATLVDPKATYTAPRTK